jgi:hypothetical protein
VAQVGIDPISSERGGGDETDDCSCIRRSAAAVRVSSVGKIVLGPVMWEVRPFLAWSLIGSR